MARWWTEVWSIGGGQSRQYCGIAKTEEGFAVDLFYGDSCVASEVYQSRAAARDAALALKPSLPRARRGVLEMVMDGPGRRRARRLESEERSSTM